MVEPPDSEFFGERRASSTLKLDYTNRGCVSLLAAEIKHTSPYLWVALGSAQCSSAVSGPAEGFGGTKMQMASDDELEARFQEAHGAYLFREGEPRVTQVGALSMASDEELEARFQEAHGAYVFREGKPRGVLEVKSPQISTAIYEARLRGYDRAAKAAENPSLARKK
jgi:hypothetical protein